MLAVRVRPIAPPTDAAARAELKAKICDRKMRYPSMSAAQREVERLKRDNGPLLTLTLITYRCPFCHGCHVGKHKFDPILQERWTLRSSSSGKQSRKGRK